MAWIGLTLLALAALLAGFSALFWTMLAGETWARAEFKSREYMRWAYVTLGGALCFAASAGISVARIWGVCQ